MRKIGRWLLLLVSTGVCVVVGVAAYYLAQTSWNAVVEYRSPYASLDLPETGRRSAEASRTVLIIVDGLRLDASHSMSSLEALRESGRDIVITVPQPSLSYPNWTTILSGAPPYVSGVVTNWHDGAAPVETLFDTAKAAGVSTAFVGPKDFDALYGVSSKVDDSFMLEWDEEYLSDRYVDEALRLSQGCDPRLLIVHLPDVDEAGHSFGGASEEYVSTVRRVDFDLGRLVQGLQDCSTVFVVVADHGHIDAGGHGGWEDDVVLVPGIIAGPNVLLGEDPGRLEDVAPTIAALAGVPAPRHALGKSVLAGSASGQAQADEADVRVRNSAAAFRQVLATGPGAEGISPSEQITESQTLRLAADRRERLPLLLAGLAAALIVLAVIAVASRRAFFAAAAGAVTYYAVYNALFFGVHRYAWSLSAFNSEDRIEAWMNGRLVEAAIAGLVAVLIAGAVYPLARSGRFRPSGSHLAGWLTLGPVTILFVLATLSIQVAWFAWWWGVIPEWRLPDLMWGFKYDLDLIQATALGFVAVVTPLVTYLVGRFHPLLHAERTEG